MKTLQSAARIALTVVALAFVPLQSASAGPILPDGTWVGFCFQNFGPATSGCQNAGAQTSGNVFTFTLAGLMQFQITDAFQQGDMFSVYDFGVLLFMTSLVPNTGTDFGVTDPNLAYADARYSHGAATLGAGNHEITVFNVQGCCVNGGGAFLRLATVPEPGTLALMAVALIGLASTRRRKLR